MDAFNDDFKVTSKGKHKSYEIDYESLTQGAVEKLMQAEIEHISGIFGVDVSLGLYQRLLCQSLISVNIGEYSFAFAALYELEQRAPNREVHG